MRKYYTLEAATERAYKNREGFVRDNDAPFCRDLLNLTRMYFGLQPKIYVFEKKVPERYKSPEPESFHKNCEEDQTYTEREKAYLDGILNDETDNKYR